MIVSAASRLKAPTTCFFTFAGLANGPSMLKKVRIFRALRAGITFESWMKIGGKHKCHSGSIENCFHLIFFQVGNHTQLTQYVIASASAGNAAVAMFKDRNISAGNNKHGGS